MPGKYNLTIYQGETFGFSIIWKDAEGVPIDLTGYSARMQIRYDGVNGDIAADLSTTNGGIEIDNEAHTITVYISATDTASMLAKSGVYDLEMVLGDVVTRLLEGKVKIIPEVTR